MSLIRTFIDSGVLIAAARGTDEIAQKAMDILDDPDREFASSSFIQLEVLPKAIYNKFKEEAEFYQSFFDNDVSHWATADEEMVGKAYERAKDLGLSALDALHVAAAISVDAQELVTTEKPGKPFYRVTDIKVTSINSDNNLKK